MPRFSSGGWNGAFDGTVGGVVLSQLSHAGYPLARDIRVARIWLGRTNTGVGGRGLVLGGPDLPADGPPTFTASPAPPPGAFARYRPLAGVSGSFSGRVGVAGLTDEAVRITQSYLFTGYGKNPPHEPGAVLNAARFTPLVRFVIGGGSDASPFPKVDVLRIDFRMRLALAPPGGVDQAMLSRDREDTPSPSLSVSVVDVFSALEKPLHHEITAQLHEFGTPGDSLAYWDNYHQFPRAADGSLPSSPGAFHATHCHWRWGAVAGIPPGIGPTLLSGAGPAFQGTGWTPAAGGPLFDARLPSQRLRLAVSLDEGPGSPWDAAANPSTARFEDLFLARRATPLPVDAGGDLTLWFSVEVERSTLAEPWEGAVFIHGMYFAHNPEPSWLMGDNPVVLLTQALAGLRQPGYKEKVGPADPPVWDRPAS